MQKGTQYTVHTPFCEMVYILSMNVPYKHSAQYPYIPFLYISTVYASIIILCVVLCFAMAWY